MSFPVSKIENRRHRIIYEVICIMITKSGFVNISLACLFEIMGGVDGNREWGDAGISFSGGAFGAASGGLR